MMGMNAPESVTSRGSLHQHHHGSRRSHPSHTRRLNLSVEVAVTSTVNSLLRLAVRCTLRSEKGVRGSAGVRI